jgi:general stress protein 26
MIRQIEEVLLNRLRQVLVAVLLAVFASRAGAQHPVSGADPDRSTILRAAREVMQKARYCALITLGGDGQPQARIVDPLGPDGDMTVWIGTNAKTRKVAQLRKDPRATLLFFDASAPAYVTLIGTAVASPDPAEKAKHWKAEWAPFYKGEHRDPDFVLLRVTPRRLEIVSQNHGLINDPKTLRPVAIEFAPEESAPQAR